MAPPLPPPTVGRTQTLRSPSWTVHLSHSQAARLGSDPSGRLTVMLHGETLDDTGSDPARIATRLLADRQSACRDLTGSFALLALDHQADRLFVVPDRVSSRRVFSSGPSVDFVLSSDLSAQRSPDRPLDPVGIAWYVFNRGYYMGRTMYEAVTILDRSKIHDFGAGAVDETEYWRYRPGDPDAPVESDEWSQRLEDALVNAVGRSVADDPDVFISLSAGYDSRGMASVLVRSLGRSGIRSFCYAPAVAADTSETDIARWTADLLGMDHRTLPGHRGDFLEHLRINAEWTEGMARASDELDTWREMSREFTSVPRPVMLAGDMNFGLAPNARTSFATLRQVLRYRPLRIQSGAERLLGDRMLRDMERGISEDFEGMIARAGAESTADAVRQFITFDQRTRNQVLPWRECFAGRFARVRNPWLDSEVLDVVVDMPRELREDRRLYKDTIRRMFPDVFSRERAQSNNRPDLRTAVRAHAPALRRWIETSDSRLDEVMPPEFGLRLVDLDTSATGAALRSLSRLGYRARRRLARIKGIPISSPDPQPIAAADIFRRWAILRMSLQSGPGPLENLE